MTLFWGMLLGATLPALLVWTFGRYLRRLSGQPGLAEYVHMQQRRARRKRTRDPVWKALLDDDARPLDADERRALEQCYEAGDRYRARR